MLVVKIYRPNIFFSCNLRKKSYRLFYYCFLIKKERMRSYQYLKCFRSFVRAGSLNTNSMVLISDSHAFSISEKLIKDMTTPISIEEKINVVAGCCCQTYSMSLSHNGIGKANMTKQFQCP